MVDNFREKAAVKRSGRNRRWLRVAALKRVIRREGEINGLPQKAFEQVMLFVIGKYWAFLKVCCSRRIMCSVQL
jgi:hypothetical protein